MTFACIDFETANQSDASICAAGLAVFADGALVESRHWLVRPPKGHGWFREDFTEIHGLRWSDVKDAAEFPAVAAELLPVLTAAEFVVAHHAAFDLRKLRGTLAHFEIPCPELRTVCTLEMSRNLWPGESHGLDDLCKKINHHFIHHDAREDAEAAGRLYLALTLEKP